MNDTSPTRAAARPESCITLMQTVPPTLPDGTYTYTKAGIYQDHTITVQVLGGRPTQGSLNGQAMSGTFWQGVTLADLAHLPSVCTPAARPIGKARACQLHKLLSLLGLGHADHYRAASAALSRTVDSLPALTEAEGRRVWNHARALRMAHQFAA